MCTEMKHPMIIQGGMGIGVSGWPLAKAVSSAGQLGTVSGTGIWLVMVRRLQLGDLGGHVRRALAHFPAPSIAENILDRYYIEGGKRPNRPFKSMPVLTLPLLPVLAELLVAGSFVEVWLAKEGHEGPVAVNYLEKIQLAHLPSLYGAMLAGVDYVLMGAGIPLQIAEALDLLSHHQPATYRIHVEGAEQEVYQARFDPMSIPMVSSYRSPLKRPFFFPIISSHVLAQVLLKRSRGRIDGFIVEGPTAGGHNAPPRNRKELTPSGEPMYGEEDCPDLAKLRAHDLPFWLAGSYASPELLREAIALGASGVQVGSIFAFSKESGLRDDLRQKAITRALAGTLTVRTSASCSPSGYPFKEAILKGTLTDPKVASMRQPICDLGCLRALYRRPDGKLGYRCPAEPLEQFLKKGGTEAETVGRRCLCNALTGTIGVGQARPAWGYDEPGLLTLGTDLSFLPNVSDGQPYNAQDALDYLLETPEPQALSP